MPDYSLFSRSPNAVSISIWGKYLSYPRTRHLSASQLFISISTGSKLMRSDGVEGVRCCLSM